MKAVVDFVRRSDNTYVAYIWYGSPHDGNRTRAEYVFTHYTRNLLSKLCPPYAWSYNPMVKLIGAESEESRIRCLPRLASAP